MKFLVTMISVFSLVACAVSPTGRKQVLLFSGDQMADMGVTAYQSMKQQQPAVEDASTSQYVSCITNRLLQHIPQDMQQKTWEVTVFKDDTPNAFALPGGKIGVHTGMLEIADTSGKLAAVIGHEIGHVWANHGNERMSQSSLAQTGLQVAAILSGEPSAEKQLALGALGIATQGVVLKYSRKHEKEADALGLEMMAKAGFDPAEAVELWRSMAAKGGANVPEFMSTHPSEQTRINKLSAQLPAVIPFYQQVRNDGRAPVCRR